MREQRQAGSSANSAQRKPEQEHASAKLSYLAGLTGRDHSVKVYIGPNGGGSFARLDEKEIVLDPEHCRSDREARFVAAHEGAHIGETLSLKQLGRSPGEIREYASKIGLQPLRNVLEDGAINDRFCIQYPPLQAETLASYP